MKGFSLLARAVPVSELLAVALVCGLAVTAIEVPRRILAQAGADSLSIALQQAPPAVSGITVRLPVLLDGSRAHREQSVESFHQIADQIGEAAEVMGEIKPFLGEPSIHADTVRLIAIGINGTQPTFPTLLTLRFDEAIEQRMTTIEGRPASDTPGEIDGLAVVDVALSAGSLELAQLEVGDLIEVVRDGAAPSSTYVFSSTSPFFVRVAEMVDVPEPGDPIWAGDSNPATGRAVDTNAGANIELTALLRTSQLAPSRSVPSMAGLEAVAVYPLRSERVGVNEAVALEQAVRALDGSTRDVPSVRGDPGFRTGLAFILELERERRTAIESVLDLLRTGLIVLVAVVAYALARAGSERRQARAAVNRGRGATPTSTLVSSVAVLAPVATTVSILTGIALGQWWPGHIDLGIALGVAVAVVASVVAASFRSVAAPLEVLLGKAPDRWLRWRRLVSIGVPVLAVGVVVSGDSGPTRYLAPFVVAVALAMTVEVVLRRIAPVRGRVAAIGLMVGTRRRRSFGFLFPLAVGVCLLIISTGVRQTLNDSIVSASWLEVLAPVTVELPAGRDDLAQGLGGVGLSVVDVQVQAELAAELTQLVMVDPRALERLTSSTPVAVRFPDQMLVQSVEGPLPVLLSGDYGPRRPTPGDQASVSIGSVLNPLSVVGVVDRFPGLRTGLPFAVVSSDHYAQIVGPPPPPRIFLLSEIGANERSTLETAGAKVTVRSEVALEALEVPMVLGVSQAALLALWTGVILAGGGVLAGLVVEAGALRRANAVLLAVGAGRGQRRLVAWLSMLPSVLAGVAGGIGAWWVTTRRLAGTIDLEAFSGKAPVLTFDLQNMSVLGIAATGVMTAVVWALMGVIERRPPTAVLRTEGGT